MKSKKWLAAVLALTLVVSTGLAGCGSKSGSGSADKEQYLNLVLGNEVKTLDHNKATDLYSTQILVESMEGLTRMENDGTKDVVVPAGATKWETSDDGLTWTFHLRDYKWSDDQPVTAQQYVDSWIRLVDPATASEYAYFIYCVKGAQEFNEGTGKKEDVGVKALDDKTFQVTLKQPVPYFIQLTSFKNLFPIRMDKVQAAGEAYGQDINQLVYNGPFIPTEWVKGSKVTMKKNDKYWDAKSVKLDTVSFNIVKEEAPRMQMFEGKQLDAAGARGEYLDKYKKQADAGQLVYVHGNIPSESYEFFNTQDPSKLFTNAKVRLAFSLALDREAFVKTVMKRGIAAYGWTSFSVASGDKEYRSEVPEPLKAVKDQDPKELLKQGLQELGMDPNAPITVNYLSSGTDALSRSMAEFDQSQWQTKLGVTVKLDAVSDFAQFQDKINNLEYQIAGMGWGADYNDPMTFLDMFTTGNGNNNGKWSNAEYDKLIKQVSNETDFAKRTQLFAQAEKILLVDDCAIAPTYYRDKNTFIQPYVKGLQLPLFAADYEAKYAYTEGRP